MTQLSPYLAFPNTKEALKYYEEVLVQQILNV